MLKFRGFGPLPLADSRPGVFLVCFGSAGERDGGWGEVPSAEREVLVPLYFQPYEELCVSN